MYLSVRRNAVPSSEDRLVSSSSVPNPLQAANRSPRSTKHSLKPRTRVSSMDVQFQTFRSQPLSNTSAPPNTQNIRLMFERAAARSGISISTALPPSHAEIKDRLRTPKTPGSAMSPVWHSVVEGAQRVLSPTGFRPRTCDGTCRNRLHKGSQDDLPQAHVVSIPNLVRCPCILQSSAGFDISLPGCSDQLGGQRRFHDTSKLLHQGSVNMFTDYFSGVDQNFRYVSPL